MMSVKDGMKMTNPKKDDGNENHTNFRLRESPITSSKEIASLLYCKFPVLRSLWSSILCSKKEGVWAGPQISPLAPFASMSSYFQTIFNFIGNPVEKRPQNRDTRWVFKSNDNYVWELWQSIACFDDNRSPNLGLELIGGCSYGKPIIFKTCKL